MNKKEKQQYIDIIKPMLTQKRFEHSLNVSEEAVKLAKNTVPIPKSGACRAVARYFEGYTPGETVENSRGLWYNYE